MSDTLQVIQRGVDSSGRPVRGTRQNFQFYDRVNQDAANGLLVIVQGSFSFAESSAGTHAQAMCMDYRTWNLSTLVRNQVVRYGRDLMGTMWYRTYADGFDPHIHNNLIGDSPAAYAALTQVSHYIAGLNGLANRQRDRDPYRPRGIHDYIYLEDDMFEDQDRTRLKNIESTLLAFKNAEWKRDKAEKERDRQRFRKQITEQGKIADQLTVLINQTSDEATKGDLRKLQESILVRLKNDPDVTEEDNPSDDAMGEMNLG